MDKNKKTKKTREEKLADAVGKMKPQDETDAYYKALDIIAAGQTETSATEVFEGGTHNNTAQQSVELAKAVAARLFPRQA